MWLRALSICMIKVDLRMGKGGSERRRIHLLLGDFEGVCLCMVCTVHSMKGCHNLQEDWAGTMPTKHLGRTSDSSRSTNDETLHTSIRLGTQN